MYDVQCDHLVKPFGGEDWLRPNKTSLFPVLEIQIFERPKTGLQSWSFPVLGISGPHLVLVQSSPSLLVVLRLDLQALLVAAAREIQPAHTLVFGGCKRLWGWLVGAANEAYNRQNECKTLDFGGDVWRRWP